MAAIVDASPAGARGARRAPGWIGMSWCCAALLLAVRASAAEWTAVASDVSDNRYSVDLQTVIRDSPMVKAYVRTDYAAPRGDATSGKTVYAAIDRLVVNCETSAFALESRSLVLADGSQSPAVASRREDLEFRTAAPGSMSETIVRYLCRNNGSSR